MMANAHAGIDGEDDAREEEGDKGEEDDHTADDSAITTEGCFTRQVTTTFNNDDSAYTPEEFSTLIILFPQKIVSVATVEEVVCRFRTEDENEDKQDRTRVNQLLDRG
jgi:hypothetical protein